MLTRKKILFYTLTAALVIRGIFAALTANSMFANYHLVPGLDMQTLLRFSEWSSPGCAAPPFFSLHRLLIYLVWLINGHSHQVWMIFAVQSLLGILAAAVIADLTLTLTGKRRGALTAGIIAAAYLPFLVYEFSVLQDSTAVNLTLFAVWATINALKKRFSPSWSLAAASIWALALAGRPTAVILALISWAWCAWKMYRRQQLKKLYPFVLLLIILLGSFSAFNAARGWDFSPFYQVRSYSKTFNTAPGSNTPASDMQVAYNALCRTPWLFAAYERQENQNIYFWCEKLPLLHLLPAPGLVIPAAAAAFLIMLSAGWWKKSRFWYILVPVLALALPLCVRDVIGRYRLMLVPYFIIAAIMGYYAYRTLTIRRKYLALLAGGIAAALSVYAGTSMPRTRSEDHHAWALALENTPGAKKDAILAAFEEYWTASGYRSEKAFRAFIDRLLHFGELPAAEALILQAYQNNISPDIAGYYHCWVYVLRNQPVQVERIAARINPDRLPPDLRKTFIRLRQDTRNILHNRQK